jgi:hypothetical protein
VCGSLSIYRNISKYTQQVKECAARAQRAAVAKHPVAEQEQLQQRLQADGEEQICDLQRKFTDALQVHIPKTAGALKSRDYWTS